MSLSLPACPSASDAACEKARYRVAHRNNRQPLASRSTLDANPTQPAGRMGASIDAMHLLGGVAQVEQFLISLEKSIVRLGELPHRIHFLVDVDLLQSVGQSVTGLADSG